MFIGMLIFPLQLKVLQRDNLSDRFKGYSRLYVDPFFKLILHKGDSIKAKFDFLLSRQSMRKYECYFFTGGILALN